MGELGQFILVEGGGIFSLTERIVSRAVQTWHNVVSGKLSSHGRTEDDRTQNVQHKNNSGPTFIPLNHQTVASLLSQLELLGVLAARVRVGLHPAPGLLDTIKFQIFPLISSESAPGKSDKISENLSTSWSVRSGYCFVYT